ncbi:GTP-binding protein Sey1, putative [Metarhizium acridum CQMa 102]|uniref:GTP-binding protein Sey1, putative n=1 Tax=Metarhizium acridum (strain CQMa 102) TaxID=655827 RepID=E9EEP2_METAQ|nr:GTP-binding protein Sey1, putative [Metarhizium acridum CQMa 102]EFY85624.1 GTP-binding protein Sey1, putative [Metarhizium acridum CQMa 102]
MLFLSPMYLVLAALVLAALHLARCLASPLRKLPGPTISLFTSLVLKWKELNAQRTPYIHALHQKYGPGVRVSPNEVSYTSWPALKEIYCSGGSGYDKSDFYNLFRIYGRRFVCSNKVCSLRELLFHMANHHQALHAYACDCITHHLFHPNGSDCIGKKADEDMMHQVAADDSLQNRLISHYSPTLHRLLAGILSLFVKPRSVPLADNYVLETSKRTDMASFTLMSRLEEKSSDLDLDHIDMAAECLDHMVAGIDTTGDTLCFLMWELSQPRSLHLQRRLSDEVRKNPDAGIDQLPFLDAVLCEGLRYYPAIPMSLPRLVPRGGRTIDGFHVPEKTIVSCQAYSVHRMNTDVFPDPDAFHPDRWMAAEGDADRRRLLFAFSNGGRGCVGKHLAIAEMKTLLRDVYSRYSTTPDASMTAESMAMSDQLISTRPLGKKCLLKFHLLPDDDIKATGGSE